MIKQSIFRCITVSAAIAAIASLCTITVSTASIQAEDMDATALREHGLEEAAQWSETKATTRRGFAAIIHNFTYPGLWMFWLRSFALLFVSVFIGTVSVTVWNERSRSANNQMQNIGSNAPNSDL